MSAKLIDRPTRRIRQPVVTRRVEPKPAPTKDEIRARRLAADIAARLERN
jgi:hypothetical protein